DMAKELACELAGELRRRGEVLIARGELAPALDVLRQELDLRRSQLAHDPADAENRRQVSRTAARIAQILVLRSAITTLREEGDGVNASEAARAHDAAWTLRTAASTLAAQGDAAGALALHREGLAVRRERAARGPGDAALRLDISWSLMAIADL